MSVLTVDSLLQASQNKSRITFVAMHVYCDAAVRLFAQKPGKGVSLCGDRFSMASLGSMERGAEQGGE